MPGYILFNTAQRVRVIDDNQAGMTLKIPSAAGRDLREKGLEEMPMGGLVFERVAAP